MKKKGIQLNQAFGAVLTLILVALLIIIAIYLVTSLQTSMRTPNTAGAVVNESISYPTVTGITLGAASRIDGSCGAVTSMYNLTTIIGLSNFTQTGCVLINATDMSRFGTSLSVSYPYTYSADTSASNASGTIITQFAAYPALIGLVGTIIFLALVIGVLVASFAFGGKRGA